MDAPLQKGAQAWGPRTVCDRHAPALPPFDAVPVSQVA